MPQVSLIVLAYNVAPYLGVCLKSIQQQTHAAFEAIIVDDGSSDETARVALAMVARDPRFRLIRNDRNRGTFVSRRVGVSEARGRYVCVVDGDDWLGPQYVEHLFTEAVSRGADIVECSAVAVHPDGSMGPIAQSEVSPSHLQAQTIVEAALRRVIWHVNWNKMFDRSLFERARAQLEDIDDHIVVADDKLFLLPLLLHAQSFVRIRQVDYFYRIRIGSATHGVTEKSELRHVADTMLVDARLASIFARHNFGPALLSALIRNHCVELRRVDRIMNRHAPHSAHRLAIARAVRDADHDFKTSAEDRRWTSLRHHLAALRRPCEYLRLAMNMSRRLLWLAGPGRHGLRQVREMLEP